MTRGKSSWKMDATVPPIPTAAATKAHPSALADASQAAAITAMSARASIGLGTKPVLSPTWIHVMKPKLTTTAATPITVAARWARSCSSPVVFSVR